MLCAYASCVKCAHGQACWHMREEKLMPAGLRLTQSTPKRMKHSRERPGHPTRHMAAPPHLRPAGHGPEVHPFGCNTLQHTEPPGPPTQTGTLKHTQSPSAPDTARYIMKKFWHAIRSAIRLDQLLHRPVLIAAARSHTCRTLYNPDELRMWLRETAGLYTREVEKTSLLKSTSLSTTIAFRL